MDITDQHILDKFSEGDDKAIELLFSKYYKYLCACVYKLIKDSNTAEDIVQEVFMELWKKRKGLNINISIKAYLRRASINKTLNHIRAKKVNFEDESELLIVPSKVSSSQQEIEGTELQTEITRAIDKLPEKCRIIFAMSRYEEMTYKEIAAKLEISVKTVENQISKALKLLKTELKPYLKKY